MPKINKKIDHIVFVFLSIQIKEQINTGLIFNFYWAVSHYLFGVACVPFCLLRSYSVHISPIRSTLVLIYPFVLIRSTLVLFSPPCSYSIGLLHSIWSNLVHSSHFSPFWSTSLYFLFIYIMKEAMFGLKTPILNPNLF